MFFRYWEAVWVIVSVSEADSSTFAAVVTRIVSEWSAVKVTHAMIYHPGSKTPCYSHWRSEPDPAGNILWRAYHDWKGNITKVVILYDTQKNRCISQATKYQDFLIPLLQKWVQVTLWMISIILILIQY